MDDSDPATTATTEAPPPTGLRLRAEAVGINPEPLIAEPITQQPTEPRAHTLSLT